MLGLDETDGSLTVPPPPRPLLTPGADDEGGHALWVLAYVREAGGIPTVERDLVCHL